MARAVQSAPPMKHALAALGLSTLAIPYPAVAGTPTAIGGEREVQYAGLTLSSDGTAAGLALGGLSPISNKNETVIALGALLFVAGAPSIHLIHGERGKALGSLGIRIALPLIGVLVGERLGPGDNVCATHEGDGGGCPPRATRGQLIGAGIGAAVAIAFDAVLLARTRVSDPGIAPHVGGADSTLTFGLGGAF